METEAILSDMDVRVEMAELECSQCGFSSRRVSDVRMGDGGSAGFEGMGDASPR